MLKCQPGAKIEAGLKKVHSLCKKHLVYQVWGQFWVVALCGFKTQHLEAKTQHFEAKTQHFDAHIQHFEAKIQDFEGRMLKCKSGAYIFKNKGRPQKGPFFM